MAGGMRWFSSWILVFLLTVSAEAVVDKRACREQMAGLPAEILSRPYVRSAWSIAFLKKLCPLSEDAASLLPSLRWPSEGLEQIVAALKQELGGAVTVSQGLYSSCKKADPPAVTLLLGFSDQGGNFAYAGFSYALAAGKVVGELNSFYKAPSHRGVGLSASVLKAVEEVLHRPMRVAELRVHADTLGRYVWAVRGFQFRTDIRYQDVEGSLVSLEEMARRNFARFLSFHGISVGDLVWRIGRTQKPVRDLSEFRRPLDYALATHRDRRHLVEVRPLVLQDENRNPLYGPPVGLPVGKAFLLADYSVSDSEPRFIQSVRGIRRGAPRSSRAMPDYRAVRVP